MEGSARALGAVGSVSLCSTPSYGLINPEFSGERLLFRLFHERGVRVFNPMVLKAQCSCSRNAVASMLKSFSPDDRAAMVKDDKVVVTCSATRCTISRRTRRASRTRSELS